MVVVEELLVVEQHDVAGELIVAVPLVVVEAFVVASDAVVEKQMAFVVESLLVAFVVASDVVVGTQLAFVVASVVVVGTQVAFVVASDVVVGTQVAFVVKSLPVASDAVEKQVAFVVKSLPVALVVASDAAVEKQEAFVVESLLEAGMEPAVLAALSAPDVVRSTVAVKLAKPAAVGLVLVAVKLVVHLAVTATLVEFVDLLSSVEAEAVDHELDLVVGLASGQSDVQEAVAEVD